MRKFCQVLIAVCTSVYGSLLTMQVQSTEPISCLRANYHTIHADTAVSIALGLKERKRDPRTMVTLFEYGASCNNVQALYELALIYKEGILQPKNLEKARAYLYQAALQGYSPACFQLGRLLISQLEYTQGLFWVFKAAHAQVIDSRVSWYLPALCYLEEIYAGTYGTQLYQALIETEYCGDYFLQLFNQACTAYHENNNQQAFEQFSFLATYKHPLAVYMLGVCYDTGKGTIRDAQRAYLYYKQAALCGYSIAQQACAMREQRTEQPQDISTEIYSKRLDKDDYLDHICYVYKNLDSSIYDTVRKTLSDLVCGGTLEDHQRYACVLEHNGLQQFLERYADTVAQAAYLCGLNYQNKNSKKARSYFKLAAKNHSVQASFVLAEYYRIKNNVQCALSYYLVCALEYEHALQEEQQLVQKAINFLQEKANEQDYYARICLVVWYFSHQDIEIYNQGFLLCEKILSEATDDNHRAFLINISTLPQTLHARLANDARIGYLLALLYFTVPGFIDMAQGMQYLQEAAQKSIPEAQLMLSCCYVQGIHIEQDNKQAFSWLVAAHNQGLCRATFELALVYDNGILVPQDLEKSAELLNSSVLDDYGPALPLRIVQLFTQPSLTVEKRKELLAQLEQYAQKGDKSACLSLGIFYYSNKDGWGKGKLAKAYEYLELAAAQGESSAYRVMGRMRYFAEGVCGDKKQGQELIGKALALDDQEALFDLANIFYDQKEYNKAFDYYKDCYNQSKDPDAAACLARCYLNGHGVGQSIRQAANYTAIAIKLGTEITNDFILQSPYVKEVLIQVLITVQTLISKDNKIMYVMLDLLKRALHDAGYTLCEKKQGMTIVRRV